MQPCMQQHCARDVHQGYVCQQAKKGRFCTRRILCGKKHEVRVGVDGLLQLWHKQLPVVVQKPAMNRHIELNVVTMTTTVRAQSTAVVAPSDYLCIGSELASNRLYLLSMRHAQEQATCTGTLEKEHICMHRHIFNVFHTDHSKWLL